MCLFANIIIILVSHGGADQIECHQVCSSFFFDYICISMKKSAYIFLAVIVSLSSCNSRVGNRTPGASCSYASYFELLADSAVVAVSPFDGSRDTMKLNGSMNRIVCMSSTHVACLSAIGADSLIAAVSGVQYLAHVPYEGVPDIGYEAALDYEKILDLHPDLLVTYVVSGAEPQYVTKLRSLGVPVLVLHDHLEEHPLARAEYVRLFGALTGRRHEADSVFGYVRDRYESLARSVSDRRRVKVLMNIPYADAWYVPGAENYMSRLIRDASGEVLGAEPGVSRSKVISIEEAYGLSLNADIWLNPGYCRTRGQLKDVHQLFPSFGPLADGLPIYNNTLRTTPGGGNDFWESGAVRPDLILEDLIEVFHGDGSRNLNYYFSLEDQSEVVETVLAE